MGGRNLDETPTWAVAVVCFVLLSISITIEHIFHVIGKKHKRALYESLEKIKSELMLLGFISLLLTVGEGVISRICISEKVAGKFHPCSIKRVKPPLDDHHHDDTNGRRLLAAFLDSDNQNNRRILALGARDKCAAQMRRWKRWEVETKTAEYQFSHDPERFRFARETSFGRRHLSFWTQNTVLVWIVCFFRQFVRSVPKVDYLTLRHGFMMTHLGLQSHQKFNFRKYIKRSLEEDFRVVVEISPPIWFITVLFLLFNTHGWYSYLWLPFAPLIIVLLVGTKLQVIITKMGQRIQQRGEVVKGVPLVQPGDDLFWFNKPRLILYLINFVLFQNAFQLAFFSWAADLRSIPLQLRDPSSLCSSDTEQMGSTMKPTIFNERVARALRKWHHTAKKNVKHNRGLRLQTPNHTKSNANFLRRYHSEMATYPSSPIRFDLDAHLPCEVNATSSSIHHRQMEMGHQAHEIDIERGKDFSFDKK
ncbi:hypothetical protein JHK82_037963 [Glycine max]|nr:hypothetical protein JHK82_037963 [Glycine max]